ncbi:MAG: 16S rRNA (uracil(1498)-N(3))-methyltransferase [Ignavibacteria bacterium]|nr:16S rRNA (uracil(1498)-N(3))-methyltransferase [Ignavibacteria bacterium]
MEYYFADPANINSQTGELFLTDIEYSHVTKVLRKREGEEISITDGEGNVYHCVISSVLRTKVVCSILGKQTDLFEPELKLRLYIAPLKSKDRFEFAVEKAVELGVDSIVPVITKHTVKRSGYSGAQGDRLRQIIRSAMCQSQRCRLPVFYPSVTITELLEETKFESLKVVMYEFSDSKNIQADYSGSSTASLLIGPEGGFDESEIELLVEHGWKPRSLGKRKLRAETAAVVSVFEFLNSYK